MPKNGKIYLYRAEYHLRVSMKTKTKDRLTTDEDGIKHHTEKTEVQRDTCKRYTIHSNIQTTHKYEDNLKHAQMTIADIINIDKGK